MSALSLRRRLSRSRGFLALGLIVGLGFMVALHHGDIMPMDHGHDGGASVEMTAGMICLGVLAVGFAFCPKIGAAQPHLRPERSAKTSFHKLALPPAPSVLARAGPARSQVFRL
jgi:hypothetical protein